MIYAGIEYAQMLHLLGGLFAVAGALAAAGLVLYRVSQHMVRLRADSDEQSRESLVRPD